MVHRSTTLLRNQVARIASPYVLDNHALHSAHFVARATHNFFIYIVIKSRQVFRIRDIIV